MVDLTVEEFEGLFTGLQDMWERLCAHSRTQPNQTPAVTMHLSLADNGWRVPSSGKPLPIGIMLGVFEVGTPGLFRILDVGVIPEWIRKGRADAVDVIKMLFISLLDQVVKTTSTWPLTIELGGAACFNGGLRERWQEMIQCISQNLLFNHLKVSFLESSGPTLLLEQGTSGDDDNGSALTVQQVVPLPSLSLEQVSGNNSEAVEASQPAQQAATYYLLQEAAAAEAAAVVAVEAVAAEATEVAAADAVVAATVAKGKEMYFFDDGWIDNEDIIELDSGAPTAVMQPVAGPKATQFKFYSLRLQEGGAIISACATRLSRNSTLSIVWIATGDAYKLCGFAKRMVEFIYEKAAKEGFTQIVVLLTHYSYRTAHHRSPLPTIHHSLHPAPCSLPTARYSFLTAGHGLAAHRSLLTAHCSLWPHFWS
jgi:hypothetical protein